MIIVAFILPILIGFTAVAVEGGLWYADHHQLRNIADSSALAAGWARYDGIDENQAASTAATPVGFNANTDDIQVNSPPTLGAYKNDAASIEIIVHRARTLILAQVLMPNGAMSIRARSVVQLKPNSGVCVLALDKTASGAIGNQGSATVNFNGCGVTVNSNSASALTLGGASLLNVDWTQVTGGIVTNGGGTLDSVQAPITGAAPRPDPWASLAMPASSSCSQTNYQTSGPSTLNPGRYCSGLQFSKNSTTTLNPGTYVIDGGSFSVNGGATVTGNGVTIVMTGSGSNYATVTINGGANVTLTAPSSGTYAGIAFMQNPNAPTSGSNKFNGGSTMSINGVIHIPNQNVQFAGGNTSGNACTRLVADTITFTGNASLGNNCAGLGLDDQSDGSPRLVE